MKLAIRRMETACKRGASAEDGTIKEGVPRGSEFDLAATHILAVGLHAMLVRVAATDLLA